MLSTTILSLTVPLTLLHSGCAHREPTSNDQYYGFMRDHPVDAGDIVEPDMVKEEKEKDGR